MLCTFLVLAKPTNNKKQETRKMKEGGGQILEKRREGSRKEVEAKFFVLSFVFQLAT